MALESFRCHQEKVLEAFKKYIDEGNRLCEIKISFKGGRIPDYSDVPVQLLYELRYSYAYAFDYLRMYRKALSELSRYKTPEFVKVVSFGSGNRLDYWALANATNEIDEGIRVKYLGIDRIDWVFPFGWRKGDLSLSAGKDFFEAFSNEEIRSADIYTFPMSISEIAKKDVDAFASALVHLVSDKIRFIIIARIRDTDSASKRIDNERFEKINEALKANGYRGEKIELEPHSTDERGLVRVVSKGNHLYNLVEAEQLLDNLCAACKADCDRKGEAGGDDCKRIDCPGWDVDRCILEPKVKKYTSDDACIMYFYRKKEKEKEEIPF